jgi:hypothetical protein
MKPIDIIAGILMVAGLAAAVTNGVPVVPAVIGFAVLAVVVLVGLANGDARINQRAGVRIDQRNAMRQQYWDQGGQGEPPGLDRQHPRLPEATPPHYGLGVVAILLALAFLYYAINL